jgi:hypothetical protein
VKCRGFMKRELTVNVTIHPDLEYVLGVMMQYANEAGKKGLKVSAFKFAKGDDPMGFSTKITWNEDEQERVD